MCLNPFEDSLVISTCFQPTNFGLQLLDVSHHAEVHRRPKWEGCKGAFPITSQRHGSHRVSPHSLVFLAFADPKTLQMIVKRNGEKKRRFPSDSNNPLWDAAQHLCCASILWGTLFPKGFWRRQVDLNHRRAKQKEEQLLASRLNLQSPLRTVPLNGDVKNTLGKPL